MGWKEQLQEWSAVLEFHPATDEATLLNAEMQLGHSLTSSLKSLLLETNGVYDKRAYLGLVWSIEEIIRENAKLRHPSFGDYKPFDDLLFFGRPGVDGILFATVLTDTGKFIKDSMVAWHPIGDKRVVIAPSLDEFLKGWLTGALAI
jgi:hypothetical protein